MAGYFSSSENNTETKVIFLYFEVFRFYCFSYSSFLIEPQLPWYLVFGTGTGTGLDLNHIQHATCERHDQGLELKHQQAAFLSKTGKSLIFK